MKRCTCVLYLVDGCSRSQRKTDNTANNSAYIIELFCVGIDISCKVLLSLRIIAPDPEYPSDWDLDPSVYITNDCGFISCSISSNFENASNGLKSDLFFPSFTLSPCLKTVSSAILRLVFCGSGSGTHPEAIIHSHLSSKQRVENLLYLGGVHKV